MSGLGNKNVRSFAHICTHKYLFGLKAQPTHYCPVLGVHFTSASYNNLLKLNAITAIENASNSIIVFSTIITCLLSSNFSGNCV